MEKLLDLVLKTPLAKRYAAGFIERGLIAGCMWLAAYLQLEAGTYESDVVKFVTEVTPYLVAAVFFVIAQKRMKKAEMTIAVAHAASPFETREEIDARAKALMQPGTAEGRSPAPK